MTNATERTLLIVEDDTRLGTSMQRFLAGQGYQASVVGSQAEALLCISNCRPRAAIVDIHLPDGSGFTVIEALRGNGCNVPVIVVTADDAPENRKRARQLGVRAFLTKPVQPHELLGEIRAALGEGR